MSIGIALVFAVIALIFTGTAIWLLDGWVNTSSILVVSLIAIGASVFAFAGLVAFILLVIILAAFIGAFIS